MNLDGYNMVQDPPEPPDNWCEEVEEEWCDNQQAKLDVHKQICEAVFADKRLGYTEQKQKAYPAEFSTAFSSPGLMTIVMKHSPHYVDDEMEVLAYIGENKIASYAGVFYDLDDLKDEMPEVIAQIIAAVA